MPLLLPLHQLVIGLRLGLSIYLDLLGQCILIQECSLQLQLFARIYSLIFRNPPIALYILRHVSAWVHKLQYLISHIGFRFVVLLGLENLNSNQRSVKPLMLLLHNLSVFMDLTRRMMRFIVLLIKLGCATLQRMIVPWFNAIMISQHSNLTMRLLRWSLSLPDNIKWILSLILFQQKWITSWPVWRNTPCLFTTLKVTLFTETWKIHILFRLSLDVPILGIKFSFRFKL
jgi:hypothetical protein